MLWFYNIQLNHALRYLKNKDENKRIQIYYLPYFYSTYLFLMMKMNV